MTDVRPQGAEMRIQEFLLRVRELAESRLPADSPRFQGRLRFSFVQLYRDDPRVHYEVWVQRKTGRIEVGLHFEGEREANYRWAEALGRRVLELKAQLGPDIELEEWTRSWTRLHYTLPLRKLDDALAGEVAEVLARLIQVMEPILEEEATQVSGRAGQSL
jgi:hypothetical protein